jgi:hypothetical protein
MNLHANAALSLNRRRQLCRRVVEERWTISRAALAAEVSVRCARKWVVKKLGRIQGGAGKRVRDGLRNHYIGTRRDAAGVDRKTVGWEYVHVAIECGGARAA